MIQEKEHKNQETNQRKTNRQKKKNLHQKKKIIIKQPNKTPQTETPKNTEKKIIIKNNLFFSWRYIPGKQKRKK